MLAGSPPRLKGLDQTTTKALDSTNTDEVGEDGVTLSDIFEEVQARGETLGRLVVVTSGAVCLGGFILPWTTTDDCSCLSSWIGFDFRHLLLAAPMYGFLLLLVNWNKNPKLPLGGMTALLKPALVAMVLLIAFPLLECFNFSNNLLPCDSFNFNFNFKHFDSFTVQFHIDASDPIGSFFSGVSDAVKGTIGFVSHTIDTAVTNLENVVEGVGHWFEDFKEMADNLGQLVCRPLEWKMGYLCWLYGSILFVIGVALILIFTRSEPLEPHHRSRKKVEWGALFRRMGERALGCIQGGAKKVCAGRSASRGFLPKSLSSRARNFL